MPGVPSTLRKLRHSQVACAASLESGAAELIPCSVSWTVQVGRVGWKATRHLRALTRALSPSSTVIPDSDGCSASGLSYVRPKVCVSEVS